MKIDNDIEEFRTLEKYYQDNPEEDRLISVVMTLPPTDRNLIIMLMQYDNDIKLMAEKLQITPSYLRSKINPIKKKIKELF